MKCKNTGYVKWKQSVDMHSPTEQSAKTGQNWNVVKELLGQCHCHCQANNKLKINWKLQSNVLHNCITWQNPWFIIYNEHLQIIVNILEHIPVQIRTGGIQYQTFKFLYSNGRMITVQSDISH